MTSAQRRSRSRALIGNASTRDDSQIEFQYFRQPANAYTFRMPKVKSWVEKWSRGRTLNLFAGLTLLNVDEYRVDIDPDARADIEMDANDFVERYYGPNFDTVILDPPYNWRKAKEKYGSRMIGNMPRLRDDLIWILNPGSRVISFGYDSTGMSDSRGFDKIAISLTCHSGEIRDTIGLVEERITRSLEEFQEGPA